MCTNIDIDDGLLKEVMAKTGAKTDAHAALILEAMAPFQVIQIVGTKCVRQASKYLRSLRQKGITPRKTIFTLIATRCIIDNIPLFTSDRDLDAFGEHLGLVLV
jgi:predicted nucleic acid-binding protein